LCTATNNFIDIRDAPFQDARNINNKATEKDRNMTESGGKANEIVLGDELGDIAVRANGVRVEIHTDGSILAYTNRSVDAYTNGPVQVHPGAGTGARRRWAN
jgi:hypothetical protein